MDPNTNLKYDLDHVYYPDDSDNAAYVKGLEDGEKFLSNSLPNPYPKGSQDSWDWLAGLREAFDDYIYKRETE